VIDIRLPIPLAQRQRLRKRRGLIKPQMVRMKRRKTEGNDKKYIITPPVFRKEDKEGEGEKGEIPP